jgi:ubiquinol-cytochrome c reductase cytochrome c subunit
VRRRRGGLLVVALALVAFGALYAAVQPDTSASADEPSSAQLAKGKQLYDVSCITCHGIDAQGEPNQGPPLIGVGAASVDFQLGTGRMPLAAPGQQAVSRARVFTDSEIAAIAAYVDSLAPGPAIPSQDQYDTSHVTDAELAQGGQLFRTNCAGCHNFAGKGGALPDGGHAPALTKTTPKHIYEAMITGPQQMPVFSDKVITPKDKTEIIAFIEHARTQPSMGGDDLGSTGPVAEGLWAWIAGIGTLVLVAVWLGAKGVRAK